MGTTTTGETDGRAADAVIAALRTEHDRLAAVVAGLDDEHLAGPSGSSEWDVAQVLSHLGSGAEIGLGALRAALDSRAPRESNEQVWDRWNAMARREQADGFLRANAELTERYESLDAGRRQDLRVDLGFLPAPVDVASAGRLRLGELAQHSWDVRVAADPAATLGEEAAAALLYGQPDLTAWISRPGALEGRTATLHLRTTGPDSEATVRLADPVSVTPGAPADADGTLAMPAEAWLRLVAGRLAPEHTPDGVRADGAADLDLLRRVFPGF